MIILYKCDPEKNAQCRKGMCYLNTRCKHPCRNTKHPEYAQVAENGKPIVAYVRLDADQDGCRVFDKPDIWDGKEIQPWHTTT